MKGYLSFTFVFALLLWNSIAFGQAQNNKETFPSYNQIKPLKDEIVDYSSSTSVVNVEERPINLFDFPAGTVTYILNDKSSTDVNYVKQVLAEKKKDIESISVGKPDQKGKRVIEINYSLP